MFADPVWTGSLAFLLVFAAIGAAGYWVFLRRSGEQRKAVARLRELAASPQATPLPGQVGSGLWRVGVELLARAGSTRTEQVELLRKKCLNAGFFDPRTPMLFVGG
jgi:hypothetical protein